MTVFFVESSSIALSHNKNTFQELSWKVIKTAANDDENSPDALPTIAFQRQNDGVFPHNFFMVNGNIMKSFKKQFHLASLVFNLIGSASFYPYSQFLPKGEWRNGGSARAA